MATYAILATIADGGGASVGINREAVRNKLISHLIIFFNTKPFKGSLGQTRPHRLPGVGYVPP
jgi:hypothetical protein